MKTELKIILTISFILFVSSFFTSQESVFRYIKYSIFPLLLILLLLHNKMKINNMLLENLLLYGFLIAVNLVSSVITGNFNLRFVSESALILLPILCAFFIFSINKFNIIKLIDYIFYSYFLSFVIYNFKFLINVPKLLSSFITALKFSIFPTESWLAFPFGIFTIYYFLEKKHYKFFFALTLFLLSFKRISMLALGMSLGIYFFYKNRKFVKAKFVKSFIFINLILLIVLYFFIEGAFTKFIERQTGISINWFSQGRFQIYNDVINHFSDKIWLGTSLGFTHLYLSLKYTDIAFLHSDILKLILELGILPFIIWLFYFMKINISNLKSVVLIMYINILFLSDNVFIYFDTLFIFYIVLTKFYLDDRNSIEA